MPKVTNAPTPSSSSRANKHTVIARDEVTDKVEKIRISAQIRARYANVGKPRKVVKPKVLPLIKRIDLEFQAEKSLEYDEHIERLRLQHEYVVQKRLIEQLSDNPLPLADRIAPKEIEVPQPVPAKELPQFKKTKIMLRQNEYYVLFDAAAERLQSIHDKWKTEMARNLSLASPDGSLTHRYEQMGRVFAKFQEVNQAFQDDYQGKLTYAQWRYIKRDLKEIGKVKIHCLHARWDIVSTAVAGLRNLFEYLE